MIRLCAFADEASNDLSEQIEILKRNEISLLELRSIGEKNVMDLTKKEVLDYADILRSSKIRVLSIGSPLYCKLLGKSIIMKRIIVILLSVFSFGAIIIFCQ